MATPVKFSGEITIGGNLGKGNGVTALKNGQYFIVGMKSGATFEHSFDIGGIRYENTVAANVAAYMNTTNNFTQTSAKTATLANGNIVVIWNTPDAGFAADVRGQVFTPTGVKVGAEFRANTTITESQQNGDITPLSNGKFLVTWAVHGSGAVQDNAQIFNADGTKSGLDFAIAPDTDGGRIVATAMAGGAFAAVVLDESGNLELRRYSPTGVPLGFDRKVSTDVTDNTPPGGIATLPDGKMAVTWSHFVSGEGKYHIYLRLFKFDGGISSTVKDVAVPATNALSGPDVVALKDGRLLVSWIQTTGTATALYAQLLNADGNKNGSAFKVNTTALSATALVDDRDHDVTVLADGRVVFTWSNGNIEGVKAQIFDPRQAGVTVIGTSGVDSFVGSKFADRLISNGGADKLSGGLGNDTFVLGNNLTAIVTDAGGSDTIESTISRVLAATSVIDNIKLVGTGIGNAMGNAGHNWLTGNGANNILDGGNGNDTLDPGTGGTADQLKGGSGNDTYVLGTRMNGFSISDTSGVDIVTSLVHRSLAPFSGIENLTLLGTGATNGTGNGLLNNITGNSGANTIDGGNDAHVDVLKGGASSDKYILYSVNDDIQDSAGIDTILSGFTKTLADAKYLEIENLTLTGTGNLNGTGNNLGNIMVGNSGNNVLSGGVGSDTLNPGTAGTDTLNGGANNDTYQLGARSSDVTIVDADGIDRILSSTSRDLRNFSGIENLVLTGSSNGVAVGNDGNNTLIGDGTGNQLFGLLGTDRMTGGLGTDEFLFTEWSHSSQAAPDVITDFSAGDKINVSALEQVLGINIDFIGTDPLQDGNGALVRYATYTPGSIVLEFTNGSGNVDMAIKLLNRTSITNGDFLHFF